MPANFTFPTNFSNNTTKIYREYGKEKNKIVLSKCKSGTY
jgi:hypothetical protein